MEAKDGYFVPVMVIQCMDEDIPMEGEILEKQIEKLEEIDNLTLSGRVVLTNGDQMMYADWRGEENEEKDIPEYDVMVKEFEESEAFAEKFEEEHGHCDCGHDHGDGCDCGNH